MQSAVFFRVGINKVVHVAVEHKSVLNLKQIVLHYFDTVHNVPKAVLMLKV